MHIDHDHILGDEHSHEHTHEHDKLHEAGQSHDHPHGDMAEMLALMKYMVDHNAAHMKELVDLAHNLDHAGNHEAYHKVMDAVASFETGNSQLAAVLDSLSKK